jgi:predicted RNA-binding Zn ribbon-like protein
MTGTGDHVAPEDVAAAGLLLAGEPLAIDLANTLMTVAEPATELLVDDDRHAAFWALQAHRLPPGAAEPPPTRTVGLRSAVRSVLLTHLHGRAFDPSAVTVLNDAAAGAPSSPQLASSATGTERRTTWATQDGVALTLGAVARSAIDVVTGPSADRLRVCASDACSLLFVATHARRQWCSSAVCGNRERVARHARRQRQEPR